MAGCGTDFKLRVWIRAEAVAVNATEAGLQQGSPVTSA